MRRRLLALARPGLSFRLRVTLLATAAVAVAVVAASGVVYVVVRHQLLGEVDTEPRQPRPRLRPAARGRYGSGIVPLGPRASLGGPPTYLQVIGSRRRRGRGRAARPRPGRAARRGERPPVLLGGNGPGRPRPRLLGADRRRASRVQVARPLDEVDHTLHRIGLYLIFIGLGGVGHRRARSGCSSATATLRPVGQLTGVAEEVTATRDLVAADRRRVAGRARPAGLRVQRDARRARLLGEGPAAARRRRLARAAHAARQPAHQHRGARRRQAAAACRAAASCSPT